MERDLYFYKIWRLLSYNFLARKWLADISWGNYASIYPVLLLICSILTVAVLFSGCHGFSSRVAKEDGHPELIQPPVLKRQLPGRSSHRLAPSLGCWFLHLHSSCWLGLFIGFVDKLFSVTRWHTDDESSWTAAIQIISKAWKILDTTSTEADASSESGDVDPPRSVPEPPGVEDGDVVRLRGASEDGMGHDSGGCAHPDGPQEVAQGAAATGQRWAKPGKLQTAHPFDLGTDLRPEIRVVICVRVRRLAEIFGLSTLVRPAILISNVKYTNVIRTRDIIFT